MDLHAIAISPDKRNLVVRRGERQYAVINRLEGITKSTHWRDKSVVSQMVVKGGYKRFKEPVKYKGVSTEKSHRKSIERLDGETQSKKKDKKQELVSQLGLDNFKNDVLTTVRTRKSQELVIDLEKADNSHLPKDAERFSYNCTENRNIVYIPVNRLKQVYQTDEALNPSTVNRKAKEMKSGKKMPPVYIGYDYDVHDGHHSWHAAMQNNYTHVPCKVVGSDPDKVQEAISKYKEVWKSEGQLKIVPWEELVAITEKQRMEGLVNDMSNYLLTDFVDKLTNPSEQQDTTSVTENIAENPSEGESVGVEKSENLAMVLDLMKAILNRGKLIKRRVMVRGKNGKVFYRMQWVDPNDKNPNIQHTGQPDQTTYAHHEEGLKEMERRQSNRFPVVHHPTSGIRNTYHNYSTNKKALADAEEKYKKGEKLPPLKINPHGELLDQEQAHLLDLAKKHGLSHVPSVVIGNPNLKKQLEDRLKDRVIQEDEEGNKTDLTSKNPTEGLSSDLAHDVDQFNQFTKKKYTKEYLMREAERQGINWNRLTKDGEALPENSKIMWMRAHEAIIAHIKSGKPFEVIHDEKDVDKRMQQDGKDSIHKHFLKLLEKQGSKDALMEWARQNGIAWKEKKDPDMNWMYATVAIKNELAKGKMLDGVRTRQKGKMQEANRIVSEEVKSMVKALGTKYGKSRVMKRAEELGITFDRYTKKGDELPENSNILWMRAHEAIAKYISDGNNFKMGDEVDHGLKSEVGQYGNAKLSRAQAFAVDLAKRKSVRREEKSKQWAIKALMVDKDLSADEAEFYYNVFKEKAREARIMVHFDPLEQLTNGSTLLDQFTSDGHFKNDYLLNRGYDKEHRQSNEGYMFGDDYNSNAEDDERPNYAVVDLYNRGLKSHPYAGSVAFVLKDDVRPRVTGSHIDSNNIPYGQETNSLRSMEDPHQLLADRWTSRWKQPNKRDAQRSRAFDAVMEDKPYKDDAGYFEAHIHGGIQFDRDIEHILVPGSWRNDKSHADKIKKLEDFGKLYNVPVKYEE